MKKIRKYLLILMFAFCTSCTSTVSGYYSNYSITPYIDQLAAIEDEVDYFYNNSFSDVDYEYAYKIVQNGLLNFNELNMEEIYYQAQLLITSSDESHRQMGQRAIRKAEKLALRNDRLYQENAALSGATYLLLILPVAIFVFYITHC